MTVLVAYNDSPHGEAALRNAVAEAERRGTSLDVLVLTPRSDQSPPPGLTRLLTEAPTAFAHPRISYRDADVDPADAILDQIDLSRPDVVVLGTRNRSPLGKFLLGTTTQRVLLDSPVPVMVIKAEAPTSGPLTIPG